MKENLLQRWKKFKTVMNWRIDHERKESMKSKIPTVENKSLPLF